MDNTTSFTLDQTDEDILNTLTFSDETIEAAAGIDAYDYLIRGAQPRWTTCFLQACSTLSPGQC